MHWPKTPADLPNRWREGGHLIFMREGRKFGAYMPFVISEAFEPHAMPDGALPVRCHVLQAIHATTLENYLVDSFPECYITKENVSLRAAQTGLSASQILANKFPDLGSVMSGDFGEIITLFFLSSERDEVTTPVKKWRYKQDRRKAAPHSDVIILHRLDIAAPSVNDFIICAEAKQKATPSNTYIPIVDAIEGYEKDKTGRLGRTLVWLREKAIDQDSQEDIKFLDRFTVDPTIEYLKKFKAVAIIDRALLDEEITRQINPNPQTSI